MVGTGPELGAGELHGWHGSAPLGSRGLDGWHVALSRESGGKMDGAQLFEVGAFGLDGSELGAFGLDG